jgi:hypothetical protein
MNTTYVPYGAEGKRGYFALASVDQLAVSKRASGAMAERVAYKASPAAAPAWDVAQQVASGKTRADALNKEELPAELQSKSTAELETHFKAQSARRETIQKQIVTLKLKREAFIQNEQKKQTPGKALTLDQALQSTIREQAGSYGFRFGR